MLWLIIRDRRMTLGFRRGWSNSGVLRCIERQGRRVDEGGGRSLRYIEAEGAMSIWMVSYRMVKL